MRGKGKGKVKTKGSRAKCTAQLKIYDRKGKRIDGKAWVRTIDCTFDS